MMSGTVWLFNSTTFSLFCPSYIYCPILIILFSVRAALQIDFSHHVLENVRVINNIHDGLGVVYSDIYSQGSVNTIKNSEFNNNRGSGVSFKQLGMKIMGMIHLLTLVKKLRCFQGKDPS